MLSIHMKKIIFIFFSILIYSGYCLCKEHNVYKITDQESIMQFADADKIWPQAKLDRLKFEKQMKAYLKSKKSSNFLDYAGDDTEEVCKYILKYLSEYKIEYAGIIKDGKKLIYCNMVSGFLDYSGGNSFIFYLDGGCSLIKVVYDPVHDKIMSLMCNSVA
jgi:hypothetical protein